MDFQRWQSKTIMSEEGWHSDKQSGSAGGYEHGFAGGMGVQIAGGRAGTASQGAKFMGDRAPHFSVCPAAIPLRVARPSSPRAQSSTLCPMNLPLDGGTRGLL